MSLNSSLFSLRDKVTHKKSGKIFEITKIGNSILYYDGKKSSLFYYRIMSNGHVMDDVPEDDLQYYKEDDKMKQLEARISILERILSNLDKH